MLASGGCVSASHFISRHRTHRKIRPRRWVYFHRALFHPSRNHALDLDHESCRLHELAEFRQSGVTKQTRDTFGILRGMAPVLDASGAKTGEIRYAVSCDLSSVLKQGNAIVVSGIKPDDTYSGTKTVVRATADSVYVDAGTTQPNPATSPVSGTLNASCPPVAAAPSFNISFGVTTTPRSRAYLYLLRNAFFSDSVNVGLDSNGMLSNSDSSSTQQITSILTELAQTAGQAVLGGGRSLSTTADVQNPSTDPRQKCFTAIANLLKAGPYYANYRYRTPLPQPFGKDSDVSFNFRLQPLALSTGQEGFDQTVQVNVDGRTKLISHHHGLLAFYPVPAKATLACVVKTPGSTSLDTVYLSPPSVLIFTPRVIRGPSARFSDWPTGHIHVQRWGHYRTQIRRPKCGEDGG